MELKCDLHQCSSQDRVCVVGGKATQPSAHLRIIAGKHVQATLPLSRGGATLVVKTATLCSA